ncbi:Conserved_hypothetical protein [Hexamita inflata]|uniref:Uncharacterized protein n=1 Tax=Hexamita inflata TaxID=28002 RepID=A0AA86RQ80_9EUKA|nr:Conserved hypothetical protein [Hexamita inflata]CAI9976024.1 Conserved hypothetical protein [Hexamita inflata]
MPPKQAVLPELLYSHQTNITNFATNIAKFPLVFDKKIPRTFTELYTNSLQQLNLACIPCLQLVVKANKPIQQLHLFSLIPEMPSCQVLAQVLSECTDVQSIMITDCKFSDECLAALLSFTNPQISMLTFIKLQTDFQTLITLLALGNNKLTLKIIQTNIAPQDYVFLEKVLGSELSHNIVGLSLPKLINLKNAKQLKYFEVIEDQLGRDQIQQIINEQDVQISSSGNLLGLIHNILIQKIIQGQEVKIQQIQNHKQLITLQLQLYKTQLFKKFEKISFQQIYMSLTTKIEQVKNTLTLQIIQNFLSTQVQTDPIIISLLNQNPVRDGQLEYFGVINADEVQDIQPGVLKCVVIGQQVFEQKQ